MGRLPPRLTRSTIGVRLAVVVAVPLVGLAVLGVVVARTDWQSRAVAQELRHEAELVELLSATEVLLELQVESVVGFQAAADLGFDVDQLGRLLGTDIAVLEAFEQSNELFALLDDIAERDRAVWADPASIDALLADRSSLDAITADPYAAHPDLERVATQMRTAVGEAHRRQVERLTMVQGRLELSAEMVELSELLRPTRQLMLAAERERRVTAAYSLPIGSEPATRDDVIAAATDLELRLAEVDALAPARYRDELASVRVSEAWLRYGAYLDQVLDEEFEPAQQVDDPLQLIPGGLATYVHGFERTRQLLELTRQISADYTATTLELEADADRRLRNTVATGLVFALLSLAVTHRAIRSITTPVRALSQRARLINDGDLATTGPQQGPADVGLVHAALDDMSANLRILSEQAEALSAGRLDDDVLNRTVVGPLGDSVQGSFVRLRSMTARLEHEATHDALTGLANRAAVLSLLDRCLTGRATTRTPLAAVMIDLNGFKQANDNMGHAVGDELLIHVANRLRHEARGDLVARLGGDEFMVIAIGPTADERVDAMARRAVAVIGEPVSVSFGTVNLSASAGVVATAGPDWLSTSEILRRADLALYEAKQEVHGGVVRFDQRLHDSLLETTRLQGEIRLALDRGEFDLHLQPIADIGDQTITGYEALIRWVSPTRGPVPPDLFIPVAEQSELITEIDNWVLGRAGTILGSWRTDPQRRHLSLSVNVSARHLSNTELVDTVGRAIADNGIEADRYLIEVTESQLIPNLRRAEDSLRGLKALGVKLAIDDFGTGYASVAHLRRVQFDRLKIDRSFLADLGNDTDRSLAALLVSLGRDLHLEVVAEGIETSAQYEWAATAGCTHAQGYWIGRPAPLPRPTELLLESARR